MKKFLSVVLVMMIFVSVCTINPTYIFAEETEGLSSAELETYTENGVEYHFQDGEAIAVSYDGSMTEVVIPSSVKDYPVTALEATFKNCKTVTKVTLPDSLKKIGDNAFYYCSALSEVNIPSGVTYVGNNAFYYCQKITNISMPDTVTTLGKYAFYYCRGLKSVRLSENINSMGINTFEYCTSLITVNIPKKISKIPDSAFGWCSVLRSVEIPDNITIIDSDAFMQCGRLNNVKLPSALTKIGSYAFYKTSLSSIDLPQGLKSIGNSAFSGCANLLEIEIPETVTSIGGLTFADCDSLVSITLPANVTILYENAIPINTVLCVEKDSYAQNFAIEFERQYYIASDNEGPDFVTVDGIRYFINNDNEAVAMAYNGGKTAVEVPSEVSGYPVTKLVGTFRNSKILSVVLPDSITYIGQEAFYYCSKLGEIDIPDNVTYIGDNAFNYCYNLKNVDIPDSVTYMGKQVFYLCENLLSVNLSSSIKEIGESTFTYCRKLQNVNIPYGIEKIGSGAFVYCEMLSEVDIPDSVTTIDSSAFAHCVMIKNIVLPKTLKTLASGVFSGCNELVSVVVPSSVTSIDSTAIPTSTIFCVEENSYAHNYAAKNNIPFIVIKEGEKPNINTIDGVTYYIADDRAVAMNCDVTVTAVVVPELVEGYPVKELRGTFNLCENLLSVSLPDSIEVIGDNSFYRCLELTDINIPKSLEVIGEKAFNTCSSIENLELPDSVTTIGENAFGTCLSLESINIPKGVESILDGTFSNCSELDSIIIPENIKKIGEYAFSGCNDLEEVIIPGSVASIGEGAFDYCPTLKKVEIASGVKFIGQIAFRSCAKLVDVKLPSSLTSLNDKIFQNCTSLKKIIIPEGVIYVNSSFYGCTGLEKVVFPSTLKNINYQAFYNCVSLKSVKIPGNVSFISNNAFPANTILCVEEDSYAHKFALENDALYFVLTKKLNPEINYGLSLSGTVTDSVGNPVVNASVKIMHDDGEVKETVQTDSNGAYNFTYVEVGKYIIKATDENGAVGTENIAVKRMNEYDVYVCGNTNIVIDTANTVSGTVSERSALVTISDSQSNVITSANTEDGTFAFANISNGDYIVKALTANGSAVAEITVFNADITDIELVIVYENSTITGLVQDENGNNRVWADVTVYNSDGVAVVNGKTDENGVYTFGGLVNDEYALVAKSNEVRPHHKHDYDRIVTLVGYGYVDITEPGTYELDVIVVSDENENKNLATISGKVTAEGENNKSTLMLTDVFRNEVAKTETGKNGKYRFTDVKDGLYFIVAETESYGMGITVVIVRHGEIYGETDIRVFKSDKIKDREHKMKEDIPECNTREDALKYKDRICEEKEWYDRLSKKEKQQLSKEYKERLEKYIELISKTQYSVKSDGEDMQGVMVCGIGSVANSNEISSEDAIQVELTITKTEPVTIGESGVSLAEEFERQLIEDCVKDKEIGQYYNISLKKGINDEYSSVDNISQDTCTTGKLKLTMPIPDEYKGFKNYSFVHVHNGEAVTLVDLDDDPDTITFEVDKFSTFVLCMTNSGAEETAIEYSDGFINVISDKNASLYIASHEGNRLVNVRMFDIEKGISDAILIGQNEKAFLWDGTQNPLIEVFQINKEG